MSKKILNSTQNPVYWAHDRVGESFLQTENSLVIHDNSISMFHFLSKEIENNRCEFRIDPNLFSAHIAMKAAYAFLDRAYFFFHTQEWALIVQITPKEWQEWDVEKFALEYSDELLNFQLRVQLEQDNKRIREAIVGAAIANSLDSSNFATLNTDRESFNPRSLGNTPNPQIDYNQDIDEILRELENDSGVKINEAEINQILKEIEDEMEWEHQPQAPVLNHVKLKQAKEMFREIGKKEVTGDIR